MTADDAAIERRRRIAELERRAEALRAELRQAEAAAMLCRARVEGIEVEIEWLRRGEAHA